MWEQVWTDQWFGVAEDVILQELVQHVEEVVLHQRLNHQLIQIMLKDTNNKRLQTQGENIEFVLRVAAEEKVTSSFKC